MKAVFLLAGEGKRMRPLTLELPKPLIEVAGKPILEHIIDALPDEVDGFVFIIGYKGDLIRAHFGNAYEGLPITYVEQERPLGTAHALWLARPHLSGRFLLMFGDDLHGPEALAELASKPRGMLVARHSKPERFGVVSMRADRTFEGIEEKPPEPKSDLVYTGPLVLDTAIFDHEAPLSASGEYYLTDSFTAYAKEHPAHVIEQPVWIPIGYPDDLARAEEYLLRRIDEGRAP